MNNFAELDAQNPDSELAKLSSNEPFLSPFSEKEMDLNGAEFERAFRGELMAEIGDEETAD